VITNAHSGGRSHSLDSINTSPHLLQLSSLAWPFLTQCPSAPSPLAHGS